MSFFSNSYILEDKFIGVLADVERPSGFLWYDPQNWIDAEQWNDGNY